MWNTMLEKAYTYRTALPCGRSLETLRRDLSARADRIGYAVLPADGGETLSLRPKNRLCWQHNSFRPDMQITLRESMLHVRCTPTRFVRGFTLVLSCLLLLLQIVFLCLPASWPALVLPLLILLFLHLLVIVGVRLTARRIVNDFFQRTS